MTANANIKSRDTADICKRLRSSIELALGRDLDSAFLYGSRARGDAGPDSDWDVLVMLHDDADWLKAREKMRHLTGKIAEDTNERVSIFPLRWMDANEHAGLLANVAHEGLSL